MQIIKEHIKQNTFKPVYLLYGSEDYLKKLYKNKLKEAIVGNGDDMNYSYFEGKGVDVNKVISIAQTLPFFSERRLVILENTGLFKTASEFADFIKEFPDTTHIVFVEQEVDKRNRLYKVVKDIGTISEMNGMDERNLKIWIAQLLSASKKKVTEQTVLYLLNKTGSDMENISSEIEKLICYAYDKEVITTDDVDAICTTQLTNKIFMMIDAIGSKNQKAALELYYDLLALKEKPMSILFLITRQFNILLQVKELAALQFSGAGLASKAGIPPFTVNKYMAQSRNFTKPVLMEALKTCVDVEEQVKTGRMNDKMGVELIIVKFSQKD